MTLLLLTVILEQIRLFFFPQSCVIIELSEPRLCNRSGNFTLQLRSYLGGNSLVCLLCPWLAALGEPQPPDSRGKAVTMVPVHSTPDPTAQCPTVLSALLPAPLRVPTCTQHKAPNYLDEVLLHKGQSITNDGTNVPPPCREQGAEG